MPAMGSRRSDEAIGDFQGHDLVWKAEGQGLLFFYFKKNRILNRRINTGSLHILELDLLSKLGN